MGHVAWLDRFVVRPAHRGLAEARRRWLAFGELWRRSLQLRVVVSTLALSLAVVFVLGMVLQTEITERLMATKRQAAIAQAESSALVVQRELIGVNPGADALEGRFRSALNKLTSPGSDQQDAASSAAGAFQPVLADGAGMDSSGRTPSAGPYHDVPPSLRRYVENGTIATLNNTVDREGGRTTMLIVGVPVTSSSHPLQLYLLFPLTAEQRTISVVQSTLLVGGLVLLLLLTGIANLVTRQVVRPVRQAAEVAERFADGKLEERVPVVGEDEVARLAESFNEMAASIQDQIRQLEEFGQLQRRFTSDVSHELRTPLTTVRMAADVLHASREQFPDGLARSTELLVDELDRFEALLGDLLEISRLDAGVEELSAEVADLRVLVHHAVDAVRAIADTAGTPIELDLPDEEVNAELDARRIERILRNLLANAVDHGEGMPVEVRVASDEHAVAVTVRDHGVGLRPGEAELVFTRFWRADPSRNRRTGGTGLGLSISLEDARLHGGWLEADGAPGGGACFRLTLPRRQGDELMSSPLELTPAGAEAAGEDEEAAGLEAVEPPSTGAGHGDRGSYDEANDVADDVADEAGVEGTGVHAGTPDAGAEDQGAGAEHAAVGGGGGIPSGDGAHPGRDTRGPGGGGGIPSGDGAHPVGRTDGERQATAEDGAAEPAARHGSTWEEVG